MSLRGPRRLAVATLAALAVAGLPSVAAAAPGGVAYLDGGTSTFQGHVWVSNLDGSKKVQLSTGDPWFNAVTQSSSGGVLATKNEPGKIAQLSAFQTWDASGNPAKFGPLNNAAGGASSLAMPLSLAMTSSNGVMLYGYSACYNFCASLVQGYYLQATATASVGPPIDGQSGLKFPSLAGDRMVGVSGATSLAVLDADQNLVGSQATPWADYTNLDFSAIGPGGEIHNTSLSKDGVVMAAEIWFDAPTSDRVLLVKSTGLGGTYVDDCWVPAVGEASSGSVSPDGTRIAWKDDEGVKVAGVPDFAGSAICNLTSAPVRISASGKYPSLGPIDVDAIWAARNPTPPPPPAPPPTGPAPPPPPANLTLPVIPKLAVPGLSSPAGTSLTVSVPATGKVSCKATVPAARLGKKGRPVIVAACAAVNAAKAGAVTLKLKFNAAGRKAKKKLKGAKLTIRITQGRKTITKVVTIK